MPGKELFYAKQPHNWPQKLVNQVAKIELTKGIVVDVAAICKPQRNVGQFRGQRK